ncbi:hypothetical protein [Variovorax sp. W6]|uniref:hypothetical protein n=1 Tax=Variovorax sp. W6 TaxID=3093895 RepID=UPI003D802107
MEGKAFVHDGEAGRWVCTITCRPVGAAGLDANAEISLDGEQRCRLTLIMPGAWTDANVEAFKQRCLDWIVAADKARGNKVNRGAQQVEPNRQASIANRGSAR